MKGGDRSIAVSGASLVLRSGLASLFHYRGEGGGCFGLVGRWRAQLILERRVERREARCPVMLSNNGWQLSMTGWVRLKFASITVIAVVSCISTSGCANVSGDRISPTNVELRLVGPRLAKDANPDYCEKCCIEVIRQYQQAVDTRDYARAVVISEPMDRLCSERVSGGGSS
jgi:hypothetical protein